ncbi:hypothetical protein E4U43_000333 [Claviceps pusilla]|uniref:Adhesin domain-containing protein n=1 Tax=Claviceps pusilla TaxID=123648 RepID=A0A9P7N9L7_9HYPO|nr:hypothetical protein E4U43_000333 [Claviceps pusilla]
MGGEHGLGWRPSSQCRNTPCKFDRVAADITFDRGRTLRIEQRPERRSPHDGGRPPDVSGQVLMRPSGEARKLGSVEVEMVSNDETLAAEASIRVGHDGTQAVIIITPRVVDWWDDHDGLAPCIQIRVTVYVPRGGYLDAMDLDVVHLDVGVARDLDMEVGHGTTIRTIVGNIKTWSFRESKDAVDDDDDENGDPFSLQSPRILVKTVSGTIDGWFPLYDLLHMESSSGHISPQVAPKSSNDKSATAETATLAVHSVSGNVSIREPCVSASGRARPSQTTLLPRRDYVVEVVTTSGAIEATVAASSRAEFHSVSGDVSLELLPCLGLTPKSSETMLLRTNTNSGVTTVTVLEPRTVDDRCAQASSLRTHPEARSTGQDAGLSDLQSSHRSISGGIKIAYPASWTGRFKADTISGNISAGGQGVGITRSSRGIPKTVEGEKGEGNSWARVSCVSGNVALWVGDPSDQAD